MISRLKRQRQEDSKSEVSLSLKGPVSTLGVLHYVFNFNNISPVI